MLNTDGAPRRQEPSGGDHDRRDDREPVRAGEKRLRRIMPRHFGLQLSILGNIRRIRDDQIDRAVQLGEQVRRSHIGLDHLDAGTLGVSPGVDQGIHVDLDRGDTGRRLVLRQSNGQRRRTGT
ncbi:Uncharacterised protein [Mycobacteroides abscessus subsp. abscessus]|nr:Uncharacterised protein [Mycobacteroides abscessus subsp. abscessus]